MESPSAPRPAVELRGIVKYFPSTATLALDRADFSVAAGEIHALVGDNGAGKSTLARILAGFEFPDSGGIVVGGAQASFSSVRDSESSGISMVQQHEVLAHDLTVAENVVLGFEPKLAGVFFDRAKAERAVESLAADMGITLEPRARVGSLGPAQRRFVELARALARGRTVLVLDEPTSLLSEAEARNFFGCVRSLRDRGTSVILVSHRVTEVLDVADRVTVLKNGRNEGTFDASAPECRAWAFPHGLERDARTDVTFPSGSSSTPKDGRRVVSYAFRNVSCESRYGGCGLDGVSFEAASGEILGIGAHAGNGLDELESIASGDNGAFEGRVEALGKPIGSFRRDRLRAEVLSYIPTERERLGLSVAQTVADNMDARPRTRRDGRIADDRAGATARATAVLARLGYDIDPLGSSRALSGGNRQRVVVSRELGTPAPVIIAANPTQGLDPRTRDEVRAAIKAAARAGSSIVLLASSIEEFASLADRSFALYRGRLYPAAMGSTTESLASLMAGTVP
ncbi:MAG: ATP-binding cassette domain-containing protein [Spirochaetes bacterium]|nr:ATP-binding cassette domain-containing protein [Spirochaetota bacterium]